jgi:hypothetical protein
MFLSAGFSVFCAQRILGKVEVAIFISTVPNSVLGFGKQFQKLN